MPALLEGRTALITGAGHGIGQAHALELARHGASVVVNDLGTSVSGEGAGRDADRVVDAIVALGGTAVADYGDVGSEADAEAMVARAIDAWGHLDVLVNNAGIVRVSDPLKITEDEWDQIQAVNVKGTYFMCQAVLAHMLERGSGKIVNLASIAAKAGSTAFIHYNVSKASVVALTRNLAVHYGRRGINVNCVCPGIVETEMWAKIEHEVGQLLNLKPGEFTQSRVNSIALGRLEKPEEVADAVAFLCSDEARYITGQAINVEGGILFH